MPKRSSMSTTKSLDDGYSWITCGNLLKLNLKFDIEVLFKNLSVDFFKFDILVFPFSAYGSYIGDEDEGLGESPLMSTWRQTACVGKDQPPDLAAFVPSSSTILPELPQKATPADGRSSAAKKPTTTAGAELFVEEILKKASNVLLSEICLHHPLCTTKFKHELQELKAKRLFNE